MLGLLEPTDPRWVDSVAADLDALLRDHAHCELKAAQSALSLVGRFGAEHPALTEPLLALAREETEHFGAVVARLAERGSDPGPPGSDAYVRSLRDAARSDAGEGHPPLLDRLLVAALVEGRSAERFRLLAERLPDAELRGFYRDLMASEAGHFSLFMTLAAECFGRASARDRFATLAQREADIVERLPLGPQVHG